MNDSKRCQWCGTDPLYVAYHDHVWGRPVSDARELFEKLCLDGQQAGLSWITILRKQENYRAAFAEFDPQKIARMDDSDVDRLMQNSGIVRNRLKIQSIIRNARAYLDMMSRGEDFAHYLWQFVDGAPRVNSWRRQNELPANDAQSEAMSKALKKQGFNFVGSTICYAFMQAVGMVNDHLVDCHCYEPCREAGRHFDLGYQR